MPCAQATFIGANKDHICYRSCGWGSYWLELVVIRHHRARSFSQGADRQMKWKYDGDHHSASFTS